MRPDQGESSQEACLWTKTTADSAAKSLCKHSLTSSKGFGGGQDPGFSSLQLLRRGLLSSRQTPRLSISRPWHSCSSRPKQRASRSPNGAEQPGERSTKLRTPVALRHTGPRTGACELQKAFSSILMQPQSDRCFELCIDGLSGLSAASALNEGGFPPPDTSRGRLKGC